MENKNKLILPFNDQYFGISNLIYLILFIFDFLFLYLFKLFEYIKYMVTYKIWLGVKIWNNKM